MAQHRWHKEIKAWADGEEIEFRYCSHNKWSKWEIENSPIFNAALEYQYRIKKQPKEPQYLYVYARNGEINYIYDEPRGWVDDYIGRIKLESDDDN